MSLLSYCIIISVTRRALYAFSTYAVYMYALKPFVVVVVVVVVVLFLSVCCALFDILGLMKFSWLPVWRFCVWKIGDLNYTQVDFKKRLKCY